MGRKKLEDTPERQAEKKRKLNEYHHEYYLLHKDKIRNYTQQRYLNDPESAKEKSKQWIQNNRQKFSKINTTSWYKKLNNMTVMERAEYRKKANEYMRDYKLKRNITTGVGTGNYVRKKSEPGKSK